MASEPTHFAPKAQGSRFQVVGPALTLAVVGIAYLGIATLALKLASINPSATPIWPPTGVALAAVLLWGYRVSPAIFLAAFLANLVTAGSIYTSAFIALGNTLECLVGAYLVNYWSRGAATFETPIGVTKFAFISLVAATPISATVGILTLVAAGYAKASESLPIWVTWWLGDLAGAVVVAPPIVLWARGRVTSLNLRASAGIISIAILVGIIAFSPLIAESATKDALGFLSVIPLLWAALRGRRADAALAALILAVFAVWGALGEVGPFTRDTQNDSFLLLLMFIMSVSLPSLILSADVSVRREAEQANQLLTRELDHRVKNTLAKAQAIAALTLRNSETPEAFNVAFVERLRAMARNHELLARSRWNGVSLDELVTDTFAPYADAGDRISATGPKMVLESATATTLSMAFHELVTNAVKHGSLSINTGRVAVNWSLDGSFLDLCWKETHGPSVQPPTRRGLGLTLIEKGLLTSQGGRAHFDFSSEGLVCTIRMPLS